MQNLNTIYSWDTFEESILKIKTVEIREIELNRNGIR